MRHRADAVGRTANLIACFVTSDEMVRAWRLFGPAADAEAVATSSPAIAATAVVAGAAPAPEHEALVRILGHVPALEPRDLLARILDPRASRLKGMNRDVNRTWCVRGAGVCVCGHDVARQN